jgi:hypothetical protein
VLPVVCANHFLQHVQRMLVAPGDSTMPRWPWLEMDRAKICANDRSPRGPRVLREQGIVDTTTRKEIVILAPAELRRRAHQVHYCPPVRHRTAEW